MAELGLWQIKTKKENQAYRAWRPRKESFGEMEQFDGSYHHWFEQRAKPCCLLASIDDATGKITKLWFTDSESVINVFKFWQRYVENLGRPASIYHDRFSTYVNTHNQKTRLKAYREAETEKEYLTQFQRAMTSLGINLIAAYSPQAKGRIERLFNTLQDRLVKELRLKGLSDQDQANQYLDQEFIPEFNQKFVVAAQQKNDLHQKLTAKEQAQLKSVFSIHSSRTVNNDFTLRFKNQWYQLSKDQPTFISRQQTIQVEEHLTGEIHLSFKGHDLVYKILPARPTPQRLKITNLVQEVKERNPWKPQADHPWKQTDWLFNKQYHNQKIKHKLKVESLQLKQVKADISTLEKVGHF